MRRNPCSSIWWPKRSISSSLFWISTSPARTAYWPCYNIVRWWRAIYNPNLLTRCSMYASKACYIYVAWNDPFSPQYANLHVVILVICRHCELLAGGWLKRSIEIGVTKGNGACGRTCVRGSFVDHIQFCRRFMNKWLTNRNVYEVFGHALLR